VIIFDFKPLIYYGKNMTRPWRIEYQGAYYHIFSRGNQQQDIFLNDIDRHTFLKTLGRMSERFEVDVFAYVLMNNHYHLLLRTNRANLSKGMQWLGTTYTTIFNLSHSQSGHLFQGRYKSILVENEAYLLQLSCYIHRNPLRAGMVMRLVDYHWSSYPAYAYNRRHPDWLNTELILKRFKTNNRHRAYREKVQKYSDEKKSIWEEIRHGLFFGSQAFVKRIKNDYLKDELQADIPNQKKLVDEIDPDEIIKNAAAIINCDLQKFKKSRRISNSDIASRDMFIYLLWQTGRFSNSEIGRLLGLTYSSVSRRVTIFQTRLDRDKRFKLNYEKIKSQIKV